MRKSRMHAGSLTDEQRKEIVEAYKAGAATTEVGPRFGVSASFVFKLVVAAGALRPRGWQGKLSIEQREAMARDYLSGMTAKEVGDKYGVKDCTVWEQMTRRGISRPKSLTNRRHSLNHGAFDVITEESAYWIGFLMADGCVSRREDTGCVYLSLYLQDRDRAHVEKFRDFMGSTHPVSLNLPRPKPKGRHPNSGPQAGLSFSCGRIADELAKYGVIPRKSLVAVASGGMQENLHFWRGAIDGDGSVSLRTVKSKYPDPVITLCGSTALMHQFSAFCRLAAPGCKANVRQNKNISAVVVSGRHAVAMCRMLYGSCRVALDRKLETARRIIAYADANPAWCNLAARWVTIGEKLKKFTVEEDAVIMQAYSAGVGLPDILDKYGANAGDLMKMRRKHGVAIRPYSESQREAGKKRRALAGDTERAAMADYRAGISPNVITKKYCVSRHALYDTIHRNGITLNTISSPRPRKLQQHSRSKRRRQVASSYFHPTLPFPSHPDSR